MKTTSEWVKVKFELEKESHKNLLKMIKALYDRSENNRNFIKASIFEGEVTTKTYKRIIADAIYLDTNDRNDEIEFSIVRTYFPHKIYTAIPDLYPSQLFIF